MHTQLRIVGLGKLDEAMTECREALRLEPDDARAHAHLASILSGMGLPAEAVTEFRVALRLQPDDPQTLNNFAYFLSDLGARDEALAASREAVRLGPDQVTHRHTLGEVYLSRGQFDEALAALREADRTRPATYRFADALAAEIRQAEHQRGLARRLPAILEGRESPADARERAEFAEVCRLTGRPAAATRLFAEAFRSDPRLAEDRNAPTRSNAARSAVLAGLGKGDATPALDEPARARARKQAVDWLKADLASWAERVESGPMRARAIVARTLRYWKEDRDLSGIRDEAALKALPEDEQKACRVLWAEVDALLTRSRRP
jgi:tetratricopeptide (TPR) repeat protein